MKKSDYSYTIKRPYTVENPYLGVKHAVIGDILKMREPFNIEDAIKISENDTFLGYPINLLIQLFETINLIKLSRKGGNKLHLMDYYQELMSLLPAFSTIKAKK